MSSEPTVPGEDETVLDRDPSATLLGHLREGDRIGRFRVERTLGRGGMGLVVAATDDDLDRTVAIKIVRPGGDGSRSPSSRKRLLREARSMARISHPNVITVHEVGTVGDDVFVAMEYIDGGTLDDWLEAGERDWTAIVEAWVAAGRGLAAAHAAGLVHRDFKPANVLVSGDGRILVTDFGIAGFVGQLELAMPTDPGDALGSMTRTGALLGTPRYMAPEQHRGASVDARADQFAFCVSLWEAVYGQHPFGGESAASLVAAVIDGRTRAPPKAKVPVGLERLLTRGLDRDPDRRHPAMDDLLADLERLLGARRRRRWTIGGALALGGVLTLGIVSGREIETTAEADCEDARGDWTGIWDDEMREKVRRAFTEAEEPGVARNWEPLAAALDEYARANDASHVAVCKAAREPEADLDAIEIRRHCLRRTRASFAALTRLIHEREPAFIASALSAATALPLPLRCETLSIVSPAMRVPDAIAEQVFAIDEVIAEASAYANAGELDTAVSLLEANMKELESIDHLPTQARFHLALARTLLSRDPSRAEQELRRAYVLAATADDLPSSVEVATDLAGFAADRTVAEFWLDLAAAHADRAGIAAGYELASKRAFLARDAGDTDDAERWFKAALTDARGTELRESSHGNLGAFYAEIHRFDDARHHLGLAREIAAESFGPGHRRTLRWDANLVAVEAFEGRLQEALDGATALLAKQTVVLAPDHPELATTHTTIASALRGLGRPAEARPHDEEALRIRRRLSETDVSTLRSLAALVADASAVQDHAAALELSEELEETTRRVLPNDPRATEFFIRRAHALGRAGQHEEAIVLLENHLADFPRADAQSDLRAATQAELGHWLLAAGHHDRARVHLEAAVGHVDALPAAKDKLEADLAALQ